MTLVRSQAYTDLSTSELRRNWAPDLTNVVGGRIRHAVSAFLGQDYTGERATITSVFQTVDFLQ